MELLNLFKPKYKVGDTIHYSGILYDENCESLPEQTYKGVVESVIGSWVFGFWYCVNKPNGTLYRPAIYQERVIQMNKHNVSGRSEQLNICKPPKFQDWLSENFKQRTEFYYDKISNNETYSIKEIESQYLMKFRTNI